MIKRLVPMVFSKTNAILMLFILLITCSAPLTPETQISTVKSTKPISNYQPRRYIKTISHGGIDREYILYVPQSYTGNDPLPLLFCLHGGSGDGEGAERLSLTNFNYLAETENFIVVYPSGVSNNWNDGRTAEEYASIANIDDVGFFSKLINFLKVLLNIDSKRVYSTGISNGGFMSHRLGIELSDKITAIAPVAANINTFLYSNRTPSSPVSVLVINGTEDNWIEYDGGYLLSYFGSSNRGVCMSVDATMSFWTNYNKCTIASTLEIINLVVDGTYIEKQEFTGGNNGTEYIIYKVVSGGHTWPSGWQYASIALIGKTSYDINACEVIWNFFRKHSK